MDFPHSANAPRTPRLTRRNRRERLHFGVYGGRQEGARYRKDMSYLFNSTIDLAI